MTTTPSTPDKKHKKGKDGFAGKPKPHAPHKKFKDGKNGLAGKPRPPHTKNPRAKALSHSSISHQSHQPKPIPQTMPVGAKSRYLALISLERSLLQKKPFQLQLGGNDYTPQELAEANRLCQHLFRHHGALQQCANQLLSKPLRPQDKKFSLLVHWLLVEMILFKEPAHAVSVIGRFLTGVFGERARANVLQAVIKRIERENTQLPTDDIPPPAIIKKHEEVYGKDASDLMQQLYANPAPIDLLFADDADAKKFLNTTDDGVEKKPLPFANMVRLVMQAENHLQISKLPAVMSGAAWVQDTSASLAVRLLRLEKNCDTADLCSAPGGKARQMAALGARVTAVEYSGERVLTLQQNLRAFHSQIKIVMGDVLTMTPPKKFTRILLDAPCSGTGTLRKNPDIAIVKNEKDIQRLAKQQRAMVEAAWQWLSPGGIFIYAVCSLEGEEGEAVIKEFLQKERTAKILPIEKSESDLSFLPDAAFANGFLRSLPHYIDGGMDGFFIARLQRV